jgi:hypothetical protein
VAEMGLICLCSLQNVIHGVSSHVGRLTKAREVGRQKERSVRIWATRARVSWKARLGMLGLGWVVDVVTNGILSEIEPNIELERILLIFDNAELELINQETEHVDVSEELTVVLVLAEVEVEEV